MLPHTLLCALDSGAHSLIPATTHNTDDSYPHSTERKLKDREVHWLKATLPFPGRAWMQTQKVRLCNLFMNLRNTDTQGKKVAKIQNMTTFFKSLKPELNDVVFEETDIVVKL